MTDLHTCNLPGRARLARPLLLASTALLALAGSALAQAPIKAEKSPRTLTVTDSVRLAGSRISGSWREYAVDGSWRRVTFALDGNAGAVTFGDGERGRRLPGVTRYAYAGPGGKDAKAGDAQTVYHEARVFPGATPGIRDRADQSSPVPEKIATRIRELGGDIKLMQQMADIKRIAEQGSALDATRGSGADGGVFGDRPGGAPRRSGGGWARPGAGVGRDGRASDSQGGGKAQTGDEVVSSDERSGTDGSSESHVVVRHRDGSTTTTDTRSDSGGSGSSTTERNKDGEVTGGTSSETRTSPATVIEITFKRDPNTGQIRYQNRTTDASGVRVRSGVRGGTPPETGGRGGFDEAWMDQALPWLMDALYMQWKRENDLVQSGGMIAQPGRGDEPSLVINEGPDVGASAVTNCGDAGTNPCARFEGAVVDTRERMNSLSQPPRDGPTGGPLGGAMPSIPMPNPPPKQ
jgi:hypothetical protein